MGLHVNDRPKLEPQGQGGSREGGGIRTYKQPHTPLHGQTGHPTMPHFMDEPKQEKKNNIFEDLVNSVALGIHEYEGLDPTIIRVMYFWEFIHLKQRHSKRVRTHYWGGQSSQKV